jgi:hypothetical protein
MRATESLLLANVPSGDYTDAAWFVAEAGFEHEQRELILES